MGVHGKILILYITAVLSLLAGGCTLPVERTPLAEPPARSADVRPSPVGFNKLRFSIPTGTPTVASGPTSFWEWLWVGCEPPYGLRRQGAIRRRGAPPEVAREIFFNRMESLGYDVAGDPGRLFDEQEDLQRAVYSIGGRVTDFKANLCSKSSWFFGMPHGDAGEASITVEWTVYDLLHRKNAYKVSTTGYGRLETPNLEGLILLYEEALAAAIHNLGADRAFHALVFYGTVPENKPGTYQDPYEAPVESAALPAPVKLDAKPVSKTPAKPALDKITRTAVLLQAGQGHGSGFFITSEGHILTNAHVTGHAERVRVVTSGKKDKLIAAVLRTDRKRDVALLKLEDIPPGLKIHTLPVRLEKPAIGEDVYAIGSPSLTRLQDTVTKGIVSAHRYDRRKKHWDIQADVYIYGGNSGGPLIDENGNIVGISVSGYVDGTQDLSGLNNFIPIRDALETLDISFGDEENL